MAARRTNKGLVYLRRSSGKQETSLQTQLEWAQTKAADLGVNVEGDYNDLLYMQANKLHTWKSIRLDDAITGADLDRPGFLAIKQDVESNNSVSHIFTYRRDRLARPEDAMRMGAIEKEIRQLGVSLVLFEKIVGPRERGRADIGDDIGMLFEYYESGEFLKKHAERIIASKILLTKGGFWTGGRAPYGFIRALVNLSGDVIEELVDGRHVRQQGCHVRVLPKDESKLATWCLILDMKHSGHGAKRIAARLNELGIPSPDAGRMRTDQGVPHYVSGKWSTNTIVDLCKNAAILGNTQMGKRSDGAHRRLGPDGPRLLNDSDRTPSGIPRVVTNDTENTIVGKTGVEPRYDETKWLEIQAQLKRRSKSQRGIPRAKDPGKYPLATRIVDQTDGCGSIMYGKTHGKKRLYTCGRYMASAGTECKHNSVDAEAIMRFVLIILRGAVQNLGSRNAFIQRLQAQEGQGVHMELELLKQDLQRLESQRIGIAELVSNAERRMASETNDDRYEAIAKQFDRFKSELRALDAAIDAQRKLDSSGAKVGFEEGALQVFDRVSKVLADSFSRIELAELVRRLGMWIGLEFVGGRQGNREVRLLESGILTFGNRELPVRIHGKYRLAEGGAPELRSPKSVLKWKNQQSATSEVCYESGKDSPGSASLEHDKSRHENISSIKAKTGSPRLSKTPVFQGILGFFRALIAHVVCRKKF